MKIHVLPDLVINQIAAGEVIDRPASVVRELVDNAVDAGATDILVALEAGGHSRIRIRDNGCGMSREDALLAFQRHATSKVSAIEDLWSLGTLGFRGEALASIAAVSKVKLTTKEHGAVAGTQIIIRGGEVVATTSCAWGEGTEFEIEHLFFNTPARRKFLKSPRAEVSRIRTWLMHSALSRPHIRYRLLTDGDEVVNLPRVDTVAARARGVFSDGLMPVSLVEGDIAVTGLVAHPGEAVADTSGLVILVNGRLVTDKMIARAAREGFDSMLKHREFPVGYLVIDLPPNHVDVNVHPQKSEVRFRHPDQIFAVVRGAVLTAVRKMRKPGHVVTKAHLIDASNVLGATENPKALYSVEGAQVARQAQFDGAAAVRELPIGDFAATEPQVSSVNTPKPPGLSEIATLLLTPSANLDQATISKLHTVPEAKPITVQQSLLGASAFTSPQRESEMYRFSDLRYIGQLLQCYLLCEYRDTFVIVDMHAAHERVNYNKIRLARAKHAVKTQQLLIPITLKLPSEQIVHLLDQAELLSELGFILSERSTTEIAIEGVPAILSHLNVVQVVKELAAEEVVAGWRERIEERIDHIAARLACHASVRSGDLVTREEAYALFSQLDDTELAVACPHGRPVVAHFPRLVVEQWFGRDR